MRSAALVLGVGISTEAVKIQEMINELSCNHDFNCAI